MQEWIWSKKLWKDSATFALAIFGAAGTLATVIGYSGADIAGFISNKPTSDIGWVARLSCVIVLYAILTVIIVRIKMFKSRNGIKLTIREMTVNIQKGDIFAVNGKRVIPCTESFDTQVDDVVINKTSVHGLFINNLDDNELGELEKTLKADKSKTGHKRPLGHIIPYGDYLLLSFTHFDDNVAHFTFSEYMACLLEMWKNVSKYYADKPIFLPLLGSGIARFDDRHEKSNLELLKCILYSFRISSECFNKPITILIYSDEDLRKINLYDVKGV
jgi:hypothetical protein